MGGAVINLNIYIWHRISEIMSGYFIYIYIYIERREAMQIYGLITLDPSKTRKERYHR